mmetsp:Transcript_18892/g.60684  ORF Transcript_18892/g.60684 Transcript_18892/m.60684 type:complete len:303 (-) Transcript_18892:85-993(-)
MSLTPFMASRRLRDWSWYPPVREPFLLTWSPSMVTQLSLDSRATLVATSRSRQIAVLPKICTKAGLNLGLNLSFRIMGTTSAPYSLGNSDSLPLSLLRGMKVTRPPFSARRYLTMREAIWSLSTTTWKSWLPAVTSTAVCSCSAQSKSSMSAPCTPSMLCSWQMRFTEESPLLISRATDESSCRSFFCISSLALLISSSAWVSARHSSLRWLVSSLRRALSSSSSLALAAMLLSRSSRPLSQSWISELRSITMLLRPAACSLRAPICFSLVWMVSSVSLISPCSHSSRSAWVENCEPRPCLE